MRRCRACGSAYLDPAPTEEALKRAYENYYTHGAAGDRTDNTAVARFRRAIASAYLNHRYGTSLPGGTPSGHLVAALFPRLRGHLDVAYARHLVPGEHGGRRVLDVGCGNGDFLLCAQALGFEALGIDTDIAAVEVARSRGCRVLAADVFDSRLEVRGYDHVTLNHVIEHVDSPRRQLDRCYELLSPGGRLWLETPNIDSYGHRVFGSAWRGLEPPRHLVLFNVTSLKRTLEESGFEHVTFRSHPAVPLFTWPESTAWLRRGAGDVSRSWSRRIMQSLPAAMLIDWLCSAGWIQPEFLTCLAYRPAVEGSVR